MKPVYLDYNATTPTDPEVADAMRPYLEDFFGNPSSAHPFGEKAREAVRKARTRVAELLGCDPSELVFTSGGTESNNFALKGAAYALRESGKHIITSAVEHPAIMEVCRYLENEGFRITIVPVDRTGRVNPDDVGRAIMPETILVSIMHANNEVGTIEPIDEIGRIARHHGIVFHTDAAQSVGKIPTRVDALGVDLLSLAGHKLYGPKGIGALYIRQGTALHTFIHGAGQEGGRRAGTENVLEIVGLGTACEIAGRDMEKNAGRMKEMRERLHRGVMQGPVKPHLNGHPECRLPNTLSVSFPGVQASALLEKLKEKVAASAGSACHADRVSISPVLEAMGVPEKIALGTVRLSTGKSTGPDEIDKAVAAILQAVAQ